MTQAMQQPSKQQRKELQPLLLWSVEEIGKMIMFSVENMGENILL